MKRAAYLCLCLLCGVLGVVLLGAAAEVHAVLVVPAGALFCGAVAALVLAVEA